MVILRHVNLDLFSQLLFCIIFNEIRASKITVTECSTQIPMFWKWNPEVYMLNESAYATWPHTLGLSEVVTVLRVLMLKPNEYKWQSYYSLVPDSTWRFHHCRFGQTEAWRWPVSELRCVFKIDNVHFAQSLIVNIIVNVKYII